MDLGSREHLTRYTQNTLRTGRSVFLISSASRPEGSFLGSFLHH